MRYPDDGRLPGPSYLHRMGKQASPPRRRTLAAVVVGLLLAHAWGGATVRVLLARTHDATLTAEGAYRGVIDGARSFSAKVGLQWPVTAGQGVLLVDGNSVGRSLELVGEGAPLRFDGHRYRGALRLIATNRGIEVINVLDVEAYLRGVVPAEMSASWPMAALKAQAVAARSYALSSLRPSADYDLCATVDCQVYRGMDVEKARSDLAVASTAGVVVTYAGHVARTYYHADSGGATASSREVWGTALPYLIARPDATAPGSIDRWRVRIDPAAVATTLSRLGKGVGTVTGLRVLGRSGSGRVDLLEVVGRSGTATLTGVQLGELGRSWGLKSTRFSVESGTTVLGEGWGHGVGMSQDGARALAERHYDYTQILGYYYPNTKLVRWVYRASR